jgi:hypothetical protein
MKTINKISMHVPKGDDCGCGKPVKITERKKINYKQTIKKRM